VFSRPDRRPSVSLSGAIRKQTIGDETFKVGHHPLLVLSGLAKSYGEVVAVEPINLQIARGDFCAILGPSGCGKSTLLRLIAGFIAPSAGRVEIEGEDVTALGPEERPTNMVFQSYGLFPHLNVEENVAFGLTLQRRPKTEIAERTGEALMLARLEGFSKRMIDELSGGQQQRVALARALVMRPKVLLLDEPLAALDLKLRHQMQDELRRIHREIGGTFIFVTHDQSEAFALAIRVVVMNAGRVEQIGAPAEVYLAPATLFVADFVGETTLLSGERLHGRVSLKAGGCFVDPGKDGPVHVMIRPEKIRVAEAGIAAVVTDIVFLGASLKISAGLPSGESLQILTADPSLADRRKRGDILHVSWNDADQRVIDE
jgi:ABC-type Fe3+/spermidine/putrescine transport system ATPase subunit